MVTEVWSRTDRIFSHFGPFFPFYSPNNPKNQNGGKIKKTHEDIIILHMCSINDNHMIYWFLKYRAQQMEFFVILGRFLPFYPINNLKNQNFEKMKQTSEDIIILHLCIRHDNRMMYGS